MNTIIIGLVGKKGSGKETVGKFLKNLLPDKKIEIVRFSDTLADILDTLDISKSRENLQHLAVVLDNGFGKGTLTHAVSRRLMSIPSDIVVLDGIRWPSDLEMFLQLPKKILVYLKADSEIRYQRLLGRQEKAGEGQTTWEQFLKEDQAQNEIYIEEIGAKADYVIDNNGSLEYFEKQVEGLTLDL